MTSKLMITVVISLTTLANTTVFCIIQNKMKAPEKVVTVYEKENINKDALQASVVSSSIDKKTPAAIMQKEPIGSVSESGVSPYPYTKTSSFAGPAAEQSAVNIEPPSKTQAPPVSDNPGNTTLISADGIYNVDDSTINDNGPQPSREQGYAGPDVRDIPAPQPPPFDSDFRGHNTNRGPGSIPPPQLPEME